jgi:hypothetical protein
VAAGIAALVLSGIAALVLSGCAALVLSGCAKSSTPPRRSAGDASEPATARRAAQPSGRDRARAQPADPKESKRAGSSAGERGKVSHAAYGRLLKRHVQHGLVDYAGWRRSAADRKALRGYLMRLAAVEPAALSGKGDGALSRGAALAFWINAYNASVIRGVMEHLKDDPDYRVSKDGFVFFSKRRYEIAGVKLSLNALEHGVLRGAYGHKDVKALDEPALRRVKRLHAGVLARGEKHVDPRIHFALVCAARGCPPLRPEAYRGDLLDKQLVDQTRSYVNNAKRGAGPQGISAIFHWFVEDFRRTHGSVEAFINKYYRGDASRIAFDKKIHYSWKLNRQK